MLKFFKSKNPLIILLYPVISFAFIYLHIKTVDPNILEYNKPYIYKSLIHLIDGQYLKLNYIILSVFFLSASGIFFNRLIQNLKIVRSFQNLNGFIFLFLVNSCFSFIDILQSSIALLFILLSVTLIINSLRNDFAVFDYFNAGFALSAASFFWLQSIYLFPIIIFGQLIFRNLNFREILSSIIGISVPYFFIFSIWFFADTNFDILYELYQIIIYNGFTIYFSTDLIISGSLLITVLLISVSHILKKYRSAESDKQDYYIFWFLIFILATVYFIFSAENSTSYIMIIMLASSVPLGVYFADNSRPVIKEIIFDLFLLAVIFSQFNFLQ